MAEVKITDLTLVVLKARAAAFDRLIQDDNCSKVWNSANRVRLGLEQPTWDYIELRAKLGRAITHVQKILNTQRAS